MWASPRRAPIRWVCSSPAWASAGCCWKASAIPSVSLAAEPEKEVEAGYNILRAVGFPVAGPEVITCPTCGRTQYPCTEIANEVEKRLQGYKKSIKVAVMGCVVNGPGEAREADIGIAGGKGEAVLFIHGEPIKKLTGDHILDQFMDEIYKI